MMNFDKFPEEPPSKLVDPPSIPDMIAAAVTAAVEAQAKGKDLHQAAMRAVADGAH